jgi:hypothetical protein
MRLTNSFLIVLLLIFVFHPDVALNKGLANTPAIPFEQGDVVFSCNETSPDQIYIIGISHRDTLTRANGSDTLRSQIETFRISEWLIQNMGLELLLPEGFFLREESVKNNKPDKIYASMKNEKIFFDTKTLEEKLGEDSIYINAEMLLMEGYGINSRQVEDKDLYNAVIEKISLLKEYGRDTYESFFIRSGLDYLQEIRTAAMLQKIPEVIETEHREGRIQNKKAIFTIGISHIPDIIKYLKQNRIEIDSPAFSPYHDYQSGIKLLEEKYGVTIIIPRTLADKNELLRITRLVDIN